MSRHVGLRPAPLLTGPMAPVGGRGAAAAGMGPGGVPSGPGGVPLGGRPAVQPSGPGPLGDCFCSQLGIALSGNFCWSKGVFCYRACS